MPILKEYVCKAHGNFEAFEPKCPRGCKATVQREIRTAPSFQSRQTRNQDEILKTVAQQLGQTDLSNKNGTVANSMSLFKKTAAQEQASKDLQRFEQQAVAKSGGDGVLRDKSGKPLPTKPYQVEIPKSGNDAQGRAMLNTAALPARGNHMQKLSRPRPRTVNKKGDEMGMAE